MIKYGKSVHFMKKTSLENRRMFREILTKIVSLAFLGGVVSFIGYSFLRASLFDWDWSMYLNYLINERASIFWLELGVLFLIYSWLVSFLKNKWGAASLFIWITVVLAIANSQKMSFRGEPVYPSDFDMIKALPELMGMVDKKIIILSVLFSLVMLGASALLVRKEWQKINGSENVINNVGHFIIFLSLTFFMVSLYQFNKPENKIKAVFEQHTEWVDWNQSHNYKRNGFVSGFVYNLNAPSIDKPDNLEFTEDIIKKYTEKAKEHNQLLKDSERKGANVIFLMNESFSDPDNLSKIEVNKSPIPYFKELSSEYLSGNILAESYGGGTANVEFEALSSVSLEPLAPNITTPYIQMTSQIGKIPTIVKYFSDKNYKTTAIHPFSPSLYKRQEVYSAMGFEDFIHSQNMQDIHKYEKNIYISDYSSYEEVMYHMKSTEEKDFIHLVTMHNHTPYAENYEDVTIEVSGSSENETLEEYYEGLRYSDQDLEFLIDELDQFGEDTLVVFWGDHLPPIFTDQDFSKDKMLDKYETPLLFYNNFKNDDETRKIDVLSPVYFKNYVSDIMNEPISGYTAFMKEMESHLPAFKKGMYVESELGLQSVYEHRDELTDQSQELLREYDVILYDLLQGAEKTIKDGFFEIP